MPVQAGTGRVGTLGPACPVNARGQASASAAPERLARSAVKGPRFAAVLAGTRAPEAGAGPPTPYGSVPLVRVTAGR
ncbi:hypothetical protein [Streptomyces sp. YKOK-I1]